MPQIWFVTGSSRGLGRAIVNAALEAGDAVVATARRPEQLEDFVAKDGENIFPIALDVTDAQAVRAAIAQAHDHFGRLDVIVNNAGYANVSPIETVDDADFRTQFETNFWGVYNVSKAAIPVFRGQGSGLFMQISSVGGRVGGSPGIASYQAAKFAIDGFSRVLRAETRPFGVKVLVVEPSGFRTDWAGSSMVRADPIDAYEKIDAIAERRASQQEDNNGSQPGNPELAARALLETLDRDDPPFRLLLGNVAYDVAVDRYEQRLQEFRAGEAVARGADDR